MEYGEIWHRTVHYAASLSYQIGGDVGLVEESPKLKIW